jgi:hypothetical protein
VLVGDGAQLGVVGGLAHEVDGDHADGPLGDERLDRGGVDGADVWADVGEHGPGAGPHDGVTGCRERVVGDDHLVARARAEHLERQVEGRAAVACCQGVCGAGGPGEVLLEGDACGSGA